MKLRYVTITGADDKTSHEKMIEISRKYPFVEWGILFSPKVIGRESVARYPSLEWVKELKKKVEAEGLEMNFSAHLCGGYTREMIEKGTNNLVSENLKEVGHLFSRVQLNFNASGVDVHEEFYNFLQKHDVDISFILQNNKANAAVIQEVQKREIDVDLLWDSSGGRGVESQDEWAQPSFTHFTGYAGGLNPENIGAKLEKFFFANRDTEVWIDTESGVRTNEELDLEKVEKFLEIASKYADMPPARVPFTEEDRYVIAEFIFSNDTDVLILSDCSKLVEVLVKHKLIEGSKEEWLEHIDKKSPGIVNTLSEVLATKISGEQGKEIMDEYYGRK